MAANTPYQDGDIVTGANLSQLPDDRQTFSKYATTTYSAVTYDNILANTSGGAFTITLPSSPSNGELVRFTDGGDWEDNNLTIDGNGTNIHGDSTLTCDILNASFTLVYSSDLAEWRISGL
jgi:hypothetical protein